MKVIQDKDKKYIIYLFPNNWIPYVLCRSNLEEIFIDIIPGWSMHCSKYLITKTYHYMHLMGKLSNCVFIVCNGHQLVPDATLHRYTSKHHKNYEKALIFITHSSINIWISLSSHYTQHLFKNTVIYFYSQWWWINVHYRFWYFCLVPTQKTIHIFVDFSCFCFILVHTGARRWEICILSFIPWRIMILTGPEYSTD